MNDLRELDKTVTRIQHTVFECKQLMDELDASLKATNDALSKEDQVIKDSIKHTQELLDAAKKDSDERKNKKSRIVNR
jgi:hypothetical protein